MNTFRQPGYVLELTAPAGGVVSGQPYQIASAVVIAATSAAAGERFNGQIVGVFTVPKDTINDPWDEGALIYWNPGNNWFTTSAQSGDRLVGIATKFAALPDPFGEVRLDGTARDVVP